MSVAAFTILPGVFLLAIGAYCMVAGVRSRNVWFGAIALFVLLMGLHQGLEFRAWLIEGAFPGRVSGEIPETTVNILGALIALHLVRSRITLERQVHELQEAEVIFRNVQDAIFGLRVAGAAPEVVHANPAFRRTFGRGRGMADGTALYEAVDPRFAEAVAGLVEDCRSERTMVERVVHVDVPATDSYWHVRVVPVGHAERAQRFVGTALDVTVRQREQHRREAQLHDERERAERANAAKSAFLARMSHELRTPLNAILGMAEIIRDRLMGDDLGRYSDYAADIHASSEHLLSLINDLLDIARLENERYEIRPEWLDTDDVLRHATRMVGVRAEHAGIALDADCRAPSLHADARALRQILVNLLTNAVKFTGAGGRVTLRTTRTPGDGLAISVTDTGPGIPPAEQERILEPFEQGRARLSSDHEEGTGLGLAICRQLMELHDGRLDLDSTPGEGTTVTIVFPPARVADTANAVGA